MITVFLNADGTHAIGHYLLIYAQTGVRCQTQCDGTLTAERGGEGFLASVGPEAVVERLVAWTAKHSHRTPWSNRCLRELEELVGRVMIWTHGDADLPHRLELDETRIHDAMALSEHIKRLEGALGQPLFRRTTRKVELTDEGARQRSRPVLRPPRRPPADASCFAPMSGTLRESPRGAPGRG